MIESVPFLATIALLQDLPDHGLIRGHVGTVVESLGPGVFEVEFCDSEGRTQVNTALRGDQFLVLSFSPMHG
jgi:hypothetical protein